MTNSAASAAFVATRPGSVALLTCMVALGQMSLGLYLPSMPSIGEGLDAARSDVQLTLTVFLAGFAVSQLVWGPVADRYGRRLTVLIGLAIFAVGGVACALAQSIEHLIAFRFLQALGACAGQVVARATVRDATEGVETARVMGYITLAMSLSPAITPAAGGFLETHFGWRANFLALGLVGVTLFALVLFRLPETLRNPVRNALSPVQMVRNFSLLLRDRQYVGYLLVVGTMFGVLMAYTTGTPYVLMEALGWSPQAFGLLVLFNVAAFLSASLTATRLTPRFGPARMVRLGVAFCGVAGLAMAASPLVGHLSTPAIIAPMMVFLAGMALALPSAMAGALQNHPQIAGSASALLGFAQMGLAMLACFAVGVLPGAPQVTMAAVFCFCGVACVTALLLLRDPAARIT